jgi:hypothetical protein
MPSTPPLLPSAPSRPRSSTVCLQHHPSVPHLTFDPADAVVQAAHVSPVSKDPAEDFALLPSLLSPDEAAYVLYATDPSALQWLLISYVPSEAPVRQKFLYGSTKNTLVRNLGEQRFVDSLFATSLVRSHSSRPSLCRC